MVKGEVKRWSNAMAATEKVMRCLAGDHIIVSSCVNPAVRRPRLCKDAVETKR
jgi:hypothetical protein